MRRQGKASVVLLGVLAALGIVVAGVAIFFQMQEHDLRLARERELSMLKAEKQELEQQLAEGRETNTRIQHELADAKESLDEATKNLAEARTAKEQLAKTAEDRQQQIDRMLQDLDHARSEQRTLTDQLSHLKQEQDAVQKQLAMLRDQNTTLEQKVVELSKHPTVELDKVVVTPSAPAASSAGAPAPSMDMSAAPMPSSGAPDVIVSPGGRADSGPARAQGQVIVVNREYDFIVVNMGSNQGLTLGQEFQVVRGDQVLGRVKVEKLYDELSAAAILPDSDKDSIREGDAVRPI